MPVDDDRSTSVGTRVSVIAGATLAVCRLDARAALPEWLSPERAFVSVTRTTDELSIICSEELVPADVPSERGFRLLKVDGPLPFDAVGIIARLASVLAAAQISLIPVGTFDTDYVLIRVVDTQRAIDALRREGYAVSHEGQGRRD